MSRATTSYRVLLGLGVGALLASGLAMTGCRGNKSSTPPVHPNWNMDDQQYFQAQENNPWFADQRAARPPVAGTVARGQLRADDHYYRGRGVDGRLVDSLPPQLDLDEALLSRGQARYNIYCAVCHDKTGYGNGIVMQKGFAVPAPSYHQPRLQAMPLGYFYDVIANGKGTMRSYAAQVPVEDRWAIAAWVRVLQVSQRAKVADVPAAELEAIKKKSGGAQ
ncbi:MAG: quinol:cytochrome C oxidoreductase [Deltaproteobacteria bacterium]|nr:MAG: quinol:cytochrome C oxidoreductase [Deltaproteobacteria bacterium]